MSGTLEGKTVYVAGPMTGKPDFNFPAFFRAEKHLYETLGAKQVWNPATHDLETGGVIRAGWRVIQDTGVNYVSSPDFDLGDALLWDLDKVRQSDIIYILPGWEDSKGVAAELALAHALGKTVMHDVDQASPELAKLITEVRSGLKATDDVVKGQYADGGLITSGEVRTTSATGGQKGMKLARYDLLPPDALRQLAEHYGAGARKYEDNQWRKGYEWSKSYAAMMRHANQFWAGEDFDEETGSNHLAAVAWHAFTLLTYFKDFPEFDDRYKVND